MKNVANKERRLAKGDKPYISWTDPRTHWQYKLLKSWQGDNTKEYARWFCDVEGWGHDIGDEYVSNLVPGLLAAIATDVRSRHLAEHEQNVTWDESVWPTLSDLATWILPTLKREAA